MVFRHQAERYAKGFGSWDHFVAMLFCQLAQAKRSLHNLWKFRHQIYPPHPPVVPLVHFNSIYQCVIVFYACFLL
ncbi:DUF4372 domain-containing protein [Desulfosarcina alkanivorans]|uniref:DUF4372 domain-containing protein n=1 Tax=Desulfosarcina alkanivorans TaxID=571177 RepID=UPI001E368682|nr:DUF4372 domain-containing protein [Desulfosarcina alkanivorans]